MKSRLTALAVLVPVLGLAALVGRAEYAGSHGRTWTIPIDGYDPRDLLHGQYLQYRYRLHWDGRDTCGATPNGVREPVPGCCLCLSRSDDDGYDPWVRQVTCDQTDGCEGTLRAETLLPPLRYFVDEERAEDLEAALRDREAALELTVTPQGEPAVRELMLDRLPWREVLGR